MIFTRSGTQLLDVIDGASRAIPLTPLHEFLVDTVRGTNGSLQRYSGLDTAEAQRTREGDDECPTWA